jgi:tetratricopeptide (TPR) repeat protein
MADQEEIQSLVERAREFYQQGDFHSAAQVYDEAAQVYASRGDTLMSAEMRNDQCVSLLREGSLEKALEAVTGTEDVFIAAQDFRRSGIAYANRGSVLGAMKRRGEAVEAYTRSGECLEKAGEDQMRLQVMQLLSGLYLGRGKFLNAVMTLQSGLAGVRNPTAKQKLMKKLLFIRF